MEKYKIDERYQVIIETFNKSAKDDLINFLNTFEYCKKFLLISDYCINDKTKRNDLYSFVLVPGSEIRNISNTIKNKLPTDYKHITKISDENAAALKELPYLAINIIIPHKFQNILKVSNYNQKTKNEFANIIQSTLKMLDLWIINTPKGKEQYNKYIIKYRKLLQESKKNNFNINLYLRSFFTSTIAGYIIHEVEKYSNSITLGWGTDRDAMLSSNDCILYDNFLIQYNGFSKNDEDWEDNENCDISILLPTEKADNWYDEYIRLPDFCAGSLSTMFLNEDYEVENIELTENQIQKAKDVLNCINSHCINILLQLKEIENDKKIYNAGRINFYFD